MQLLSQVNITELNKLIIKHKQKVNKINKLRVETYSAETKVTVLFMPVINISCAMLPKMIIFTVSKITT